MLCKRVIAGFNFDKFRNVNKICFELTFALIALKFYSFTGTTFPSTRSFST